MSLAAGYMVQVSIANLFSLRDLLLLSEIFQTCNWHFSHTTNNGLAIIYKSNAHMMSKKK